MKELDRVCALECLVKDIGEYIWRIQIIRIGGSKNGPAQLDGFSNVSYAAIANLIAKFIKGVLLLGYISRDWPPY